MEYMRHCDRVGGRIPGNLYSAGKLTSVGVAQAKLHGQEHSISSQVSEARFSQVDRFVGKSCRSEFNNFLGEVPPFACFAKYVIPGNDVAGHSEGGTIPRENIAPMRLARQKSLMVLINIPLREICFAAKIGSCKENNWLLPH